MKPLEVPTTYDKTCREYIMFKAGIDNKKTEQNYDYGLHKFMLFHNMKNYPEVNCDDIQRKIEDFVLHLINTPCKTGTRKRSGIMPYINALACFLDMNENRYYYRKKLKRIIGKDEGRLDGWKPYSTEDIRLMIQYAKTPREFAYVHFCASTGIRPGAIVDPVLRMKHLNMRDDGADEEKEWTNDKIYSVRVYDSSQEGYWAFLTPEATLALKRYFMQRKKQGEEFTDESPLFVPNPAERYQTRTKYDYMTDSSGDQIITNILKRAPIERVRNGHGYDKAMNKAFRKRFNGILKIDNDVNSNIAEKVLGHKNGLDGTYLSPTRMQCFVEFQKAIEELTVDKSEILKVKLEKANSKQENRDSEMDALKTIIYKNAEKIHHLENVINENPLTNTL